MPPATARRLGTIRLGTLKVSRMILGSNPFFGFAHKTKRLAREMRDYYTPERICEVLDEAAALGVTAVAAPVYPHWIEWFGEYRRRGGKLRTWIAQPDPEPRQMRRAIAAAVEGGAKAVLIQGARADDQFEKRGFRTLRGWVELIQSLGLPAGIASHRHDTHCEYERRGFPTDFYFQCFYRPVDERYRKADRERNAAAVAAIDKPVIAYKILAAGRNEPASAFAYAFAHLRPKDGLCVGIYPPTNPNQLAENVALTVKHST